LANDLDIRALHRDTGQLIRKFVVAATRDYQPQGVPCGRSLKTGSERKLCPRTSANGPETSQLWSCRESNLTLYQAIWRLT
jgi:hypothetical protein